METSVTRHRAYMAKEKAAAEDKALRNEVLRIAMEWLPVWVFAVVVLTRLDAAPLYMLDEVKNAQCAREMLQRGDPVVPTFNGELRTDKPVLHYLFMMASFSVFGFSPSSARLFSALSGVACMAALYLYAKRHIDERTAKHAAWVLALSTHWSFEFRLAVPDPYLILFSTLGLLFGYAWLEGRGKRHAVTASLSLALAVSAKGPVALAIPGICLALWAAMSGRWRTLRLSDLSLATLAFLATSLPWYVTVHRATDGAWTEGFLLRHNIGRFSEPMEGHGGVFALPLLFMAAGMLPASLMAGEAYRMRHRLFKHPFVRFSLMVVLVHLLVYGFSATKLPNYAMPAYPFAAVILGHCLRLSTEDDGRGVPMPFKAALLVLLFSFPLAGWLAVTGHPGLETVRHVPLLLAIAPLLATLLLIARRLGTAMHPMLPLGVGWLALNIIGLQYAYPRVYNENPAKRMSERLTAAPEVAAFGPYNPAFHMALDAPIRRFHHADSLCAWLDSHPGAIVVSRKSSTDSLTGCGLRILAEERDLFEKPTSIVLGR